MKELFVVFVGLVAFMMGIVYSIWMSGVSARQRGFPCPNPSCHCRTPFRALQALVPWLNTSEVWDELAKGDPELLKWCHEMGLTPGEIWKQRMEEKDDAD